MPIILKAKVLVSAPTTAEPIQDEEPEIEAKPAAQVVDEPEDPQESTLPSTNPDDPGYVDMSRFFVSDLGEDETAPSVALDTLDSFDSQDDEAAQSENTSLTASFVVEPAVSSLVMDVSRLPETSVEDHENMEEVHDADAKIFDLIIAYLAVIPQPTDEQFHMLAGAVSMSPEALEAYVYRLTSIMLEDDELSDDARALIHENL